MIYALSVYCNVAAAHYKKIPSMAALPLQVLVLLTGFIFWSWMGAIISFVGTNLISIILCHTIFKKSIKLIQKDPIPWE